jgi:pimeloyl-ACP methyl ester carboxylesterase
VSVSAGEALGRVSARPLVTLGVTPGRCLGLLAYLAVLVAVVGARGWTLARMLGGRYTVASLIYDLAAFGVVLAALRLFDRLVKAGVWRLVGPESRRGRVAATAVHAAIMLAVVFPFILVTLQVHPLRIAPGGTPAGVGLPYSELHVAAEGLGLSGWHIPAAGADRPVVLVAHGFNANKESFLLPAVMLHQLDYEVVLFDFRAHGDSGGHTTTFGLREARDVKAVHDWIRARFPDRPVYALGYSMGGSAVIHAAAEHRLFDKIALDSTFASLEDVAFATLLAPFGPLGGPLWTLGRAWGAMWTGVDLARHTPVERIGALTDRPLLLIHGTADRLIPPAQTLRLHDWAGGRAELWLVEGAGHVGTVDHPQYRERLARFFGT